MNINDRRFLSISNALLALKRYEVDDVGRDEDILGDWVMASDVEYIALQIKNKVMQDDPGEQGEWSFST